MKKNVSLITIFLLLLCGIVYASNEDNSYYINQEKMFERYNNSSQIHQLWLKLYANARNFRDCGIYRAYKYLSNGDPQFSIEVLSKLAGIKVYLSGPHHEGRLSFSSRNDFGHYNKSFINWLKKELIVGLKDPDFRILTQRTYDDILSSRVRMYYVIYQLMSKNIGYDKSKAIQEYQFVIATGQHYTSGNYPGVSWEVVNDLSKLNYNFCSGGGNAIEFEAFWLRRYMDGTAPDFAEVLKMILSVYDSNFLNDLDSILKKHRIVEKGGDMERSPTTDSDYYYLGNNYKAIGQYDLALQNYNKAIEINPRHSEAFFNRGLVYAAVGKINFAGSDYLNAIKIDPIHADAYKNIGDLNFAGGSYDLAIHDYDKAIEVDPKYRCANFQLMVL